MKEKTRFITETGIIIAMLIAVQFFTKGLGQFVTGSLVNLILAVATIICGLWSGVIVATISPFVAFMLSIGTPFLVIVPFIAMGNLIFVLSMHFVFDKNKYLAVLIGAILKFSFMYFVITKVVLIHMELKEAVFNVLSVSFSYPQLITALIGGALSILVIPMLKKGLKWEK